ncbi:hypothetical protein [Candidatus Nanohalococcus occultus]|uniref:Uncharacterized protein n=1 Tax=Candidatus Nanohalococcus occultus TaxID=2978047 RepID=A0ABY8CDN0_9ARCH|nr:hypothetical protein SVXNc_0259 [Candidatus Nanohaloarchaeota archaeon SVXNc]
MSKGMVYTSFAMIASALMISAAFTLGYSETQSSDATRISEASFFMDSVLQDMDRSLSMATRRAFAASINYVIVNNQPLSSPEKNVSSALVNGTISGQELENMENVSIESWESRVRSIASDSSYELETEIRGYGINSSGIRSESYYEVFARLKDPVSLARFNRTETAYTSTSLTGLEDPMITLRSKARYVSKYGKCSFSRPLESIETADIYSEEYGYGNAVVNPSDVSSVADKSDKVLVASDIDGYTVSEANSFAAAVSESANTSSGYSGAYAFDIGSVSIEDNQSLLVDGETVWRTDFTEMFREPCYIEDSHGPGVLDRMENRLVSDSGRNGIATMIDVSELPRELRRQESAIPYVYFNSSEYGAARQIKGVSDEYSWFYLDQDHIDEWGVNSLVK